jgi:hypothetical protein
MNRELEELIEFVTKNGRICPQSKQWTALWELLLQHDKGEGRPGLPLILAAWHVTTDLDKRMRFQEHLEWAKRLGALHEADIFLRKLSEEDWAHA